LHNEETNILLWAAEIVYIPELNTAITFWTSFWDLVDSTKTSIKQFWNETYNPFPQLNRIHLYEDRKRDAQPWLLSGFVWHPHQGRQHW